MTKIYHEFNQCRICGHRHFGYGLVSAYLKRVRREGDAATRRQTALDKIKDEGPRNLFPELAPPPDWPRCPTCEAQGEWLTVESFQNRSPTADEIIKFLSGSNIKKSLLEPAQAKFSGGNMREAIQGMLEFAVNDDVGKFVWSFHTSKSAQEAVLKNRRDWFKNLGNFQPLSYEYVFPKVRILSHLNRKEPAEFLEKEPTAPLNFIIERTPEKKRRALADLMELLEPCFKSLEKVQRQNSVNREENFVTVSLFHADGGVSRRLRLNFQRRLKHLEVELCNQTDAGALCIELQNNSSDELSELIPSSSKI
jgi:hypothetical protein